MIVALKEIRLEHEEGAPCTAIREGELTATVFTIECWYCEVNNFSFV
jgi:hypothetical protein